MTCEVIKIAVANGRAFTSVIAECASLYEACDLAYAQPRNGSYGVIDRETGELWSMAELIGGGFSGACTQHEHAYWKAWLNGSTKGVATPETKAVP